MYTYRSCEINLIQVKTTLAQNVNLRNVSMYLNFMTPALPGPDSDVKCSANRVHLLLLEKF